MSSTLAHSTCASEREKEIYSTIVSHLRDHAEQEKKSLSYSHEKRTASDPRQNHIYDVLLSSILDRYDNIRMIRLKLKENPTVDTETQVEDATYVKASHTASRRSHVE